MIRRSAVGLALALSIPAAALAANGAPASTGQAAMYVGLAALPPSNAPPLKCAMTGTGTCGPFYPTAGRGFNIEGSGTFVAGYQLERLLPGETVWKPITAAGTQLYVWTAGASESNEETEAGAAYRVNVTSYTSGTLNVRLSK